jgi:hypothetical protein
LSSKQLYVKNYRCGNRSEERIYNPKKRPAKEAGKAKKNHGWKSNELRNEKTITARKQAKWSRKAIEWETA